MLLLKIPATLSKRGSKQVFSRKYCEVFKSNSFERDGAWGGGRSICRWTGSEDFQYGISRFWERCEMRFERYSRETVFSTQDGAGNS